MLKVLIVDDHPIVRQGVKQILLESELAVTTDEASSGNEAINKTMSTNYDLVLLDITMPGLGGFTTLEEIKSIKPRLPIVILSMHTEEEHGRRALRAGASGYLAKESATTELISAVKTVINGQKYVSPNLAAILAEDLASRGDELPHHILSNREYEVMLSIAGGKSIKEIAREISISESTVRTYRFRVLEKLRVKNDIEITRYVLKNKLLT